jgi:hypothetical protein
MSSYSEDIIPTIDEIRHYLSTMENIQTTEEEVRKAILDTISQWGKMKKEIIHAQNECYLQT